jgi:hypothetical protein
MAAGDHYLSRSNEALCVCLESSSSLSGIVREQTKQNEAHRAAAQTKERRRKREGKNMKREQNFTRKADSIIQIEKIML